MEQVSMAVLDIDEVESQFAGQARGGGEVGNEAVDLGVGENGAVVVDAEARVKNRMAKGDR